MEYRSVTNYETDVTENKQLKHARQDWFGSQCNNINVQE